MTDNSIDVCLQQSGPIPLDVRFKVNAGEILVIVGPSGSGKTTILRSIAGLDKPESGKIQCRGEVWFDNESGINIPVQKRRAGMVFQQYALFPHLTALKNIVLVAGSRDLAGRQVNAKKILETVHMHGMEDRYPHQLSGGQQQRIAVARALAREPGVLLLDEPFSAVDQQTRRKLVKELVQLRSQLKMPIIHVTHDLNEARRIADRICIIHHGKSLQVDAPEVIMARPDNIEVANLIGHYNIFTAAVTSHQKNRNKTYIKWLNHELETNLRPEFEIGEEIDWVIPSENLILHRRDRPSKGERENPVNGIIEEFIPLGETASIYIRINDSQQVLSMSVSTHVAKRNGLGTGRQVSVSLLCDGIHLMKKIS